MVTGRYMTRKYRVRSAFTLIEVLVVVAIIALLVAILIPSLAKAREQAKRAVCSSNLHQIALGLSAYGVDYKGTLPYRGWKANTVAETLHEALQWSPNAVRIRCNLGLLHGKWVGKNWNVLYCPKAYFMRDLPTGYGGSYWHDEPNGGLASIEDPNVIWTWGGYDYGVPLQTRGRRRKPGGPMPSGGSSPVLGKQYVYPRDYISAGYWELLQVKQGLEPDVDNGVPPRIPKGCQALVADWSIYMRGTPAVHGNGVNVLYSDGHAKFLKCDASIGTAQINEMWYFYNKNR